MSLLDIAKAARSKEKKDVGLGGIPGSPDGSLGRGLRLVDVASHDEILSILKAFLNNDITLGGVTEALKQLGTGSSRGNVHYVLANTLMKGIRSGEIKVTFPDYIK